MTNVKNNWPASGLDQGNRNRGLTPPARLETARLETARLETVRLETARPVMDRFWLLTWTTYGTWLPGDERGFVSNIDRGDGKGHRLNRFGTEPASKQRGLTLMARKTMKGPPISLELGQALLLWEQFQETAHLRGWQIHAVAIMRTHVHMVDGVPGDPDPETLLGDFKSYGSGKLNKCYQRPKSGTWWTESGSKRKLPNREAVAGAVAYVRDQEFPLFIWINPLWEAEIGPRRTQGERIQGERGA